MKSILVLTLLMAGITSYAQVTPPEEVSKIFIEKYPKAAKAKWEVKNENHVVSFFDVKQKQATFDATGKWKKTITLLQEEDVPEPILEVILEDYTEYETTGFQFIETEKGASNYLIKLINEDDEKVSLKFKADGTLIE